MLFGVFYFPLFNIFPFFCNEIFCLFVAIKLNHFFQQRSEINWNCTVYPFKMDYTISYFTVYNVNFNKSIKKEIIKQIKKKLQILKVYLNRFFLVAFILLLISVVTVVTVFTSIHQLLYFYSSLLFSSK